MADSEILFEKLIYENPDKGEQLKVVINVFRDIEYLHIRKYFLSFDEGYLPSKEGVSMPLTLDNAYKILDAFIQICAKAESQESLKEHFDLIISSLANKNELIPTINRNEP